MGVILYFWLVDDLYAPHYGRGNLNNLTGTPQYLSWVTRIVRPHLGDTVLEIGAGLGNLTGRLMARKVNYVAGESDPLYLHALRNRFLRTPNVHVCEFDPTKASDYRPWLKQFDSALCINLLETVQEPHEVLQRLGECLKPGGTLVVLLPQYKGLFSTLDRSVGNLRRFSRGEAIDLLKQAGFEPQRMHPFNRVGAAAWLISGKVLHRKSISRLMLKLFDKTVWFWRRADIALPWGGLSLVIVAKRTN